MFGYLITINYFLHFPEKFIVFIVKEKEREEKT